MGLLGVLGGSGMCSELTGFGRNPVKKGFGNKTGTLTNTYFGPIWTHSETMFWDPQTDVTYKSMFGGVQKGVRKGVQKGAILGVLAGNQRVPPVENS